MDQWIHPEVLHVVKRLTKISPTLPPLVLHYLAHEVYPLRFLEPAVPKEQEIGVR